jgi:hypothetical protein
VASAQGKLVELQEDDFETSKDSKRVSMEVESSYWQSINLHKCEGQFVKLCKKMNVLLGTPNANTPIFAFLRPSPILEPPSTLLPHSIRASAQWVLSSGAQ